MSNPKFEVGEVVQVLTESGAIYSESSMIICVEKVDKDFYNKELMLDEHFTGWAYGLDVLDRDVFAKESQLRRRPPPAEFTFYELINAANNPPQRVFL